MITQIVIRSRQLGAYFSEDGKWSHALAQARAFASALEAEKFCRSEKLRDVEIVVLRPNRPPMHIPFSGDGNSDNSILRRRDPGSSQSDSHNAPSAAT